MATEKFIIGKHDSGHHEGKRSEIRRIAEAENNLLEYLQGSDGIDHIVGINNMVTGVQLAPDPQDLTSKSF